MDFNEVDRLFRIVCAHKRDKFEEVTKFTNAMEVYEFMDEAILFVA